MVSGRNLCFSIRQNFGNYLRSISSSSSSSSRNENSKITSEYSMTQKSYQEIASCNNSVREMPRDPLDTLLGMLRFLFISSWGTKLHKYIDEQHKKLGPVYRSKMGASSTIFINSPAEYRKILITLAGSTPRHFIPEAWLLYNNENSKKVRGLFFMEGKEWLLFRRILYEIFLKNDSVHLFSKSCSEVTKDFVTSVTPHSKTGTIIPDLKARLYDYSLKAIMATLLGSTWHIHKAQILKSAGNLDEALRNIFLYSARLSVISAKRAKSWNLPWWRNLVNTFDNVFMRVTSVVSLINQLDGDGMLKRMKDAGVKDEDLVRIVADLIIAAGDTISSTGQWALYLISTHSKIQEELYENIKDKEFEKVIYDPLLRGILKETLRLYPTAPFIARYLDQDAEIGGYPAHKGELLSLSLYSSGRDPKNFICPEEFKPERWLKHAEGGYNGVINPLGTIPFAIGVRSCIGRRFSEVQMYSTLTELVKKFKIECVNERKVEMVLEMISVPSEPIKLKLISR